MLGNQIEKASPLTIQRLRNLMADCESCLSETHEHPRDVSRMSKAIKAEFLKDFCGLFGKTATVTDDGVGYLNLNVSPQIFDTDLANWLSRVRVLVPKKGQSINAGESSCRIYCSEVKRLMDIVKESIEEIYGK